MKGTAQERRNAWAMRWLPALVVALGAAIATAHGLYEVAVAAKVPAGIAWLYPLITDGLAMVAYAATARLSGRSAGYAWAVVVLTAALSGLAQAAYLAAGDLQADAVLRFGVGAWPAVAIALVAHLLHLLAAATADDHPQQAGETSEAPAASEHIASEQVASSALAGPEQDDQPPDLPQLDAADEPTAPVADPTPAEEVDPRVAGLARRCAAGEDLTGSAVGAEFGVSERTGRRLIAEARTHLEEHPQLSGPMAASTTRPDLHLVARTTAGGTA